MLTGLVEKARNKCELYFPLGKKSSPREKSFFYVKTSKVRDKFTFDCSSASNGFDVETYEFEEKNEVIFGKYRITYVKQRQLDDCQIRQLQLRKTDLNVEPRVIFHYWLANWPDHQKTSPEQVLKIAVDVLECLDGIKVDISGMRFKFRKIYLYSLSRAIFLLNAWLIFRVEQKWNWMGFCHSFLPYWKKWQFECRLFKIADP